MVYFAITFIFYFQNKIKEESLINTGNLFIDNKLPVFIKHNDDYFCVLK